MDESLRSMLGIRKKVSVIFSVIDFFRKMLTPRAILVLTLLFIFITATILFAHIELMQRPALMTMINEDGAHPYFVSLYWLVTTVATVGYGDIVPITTAGRIIALGIMVLGVITLSLVISQITSRIVSINLGSMFGVTKTSKKIDCILCGWNPTTQSAFQELKERGMEIVVIDKQTRPELLKSRNVHFVNGDPTRPDILSRANITNAKNVVLAMEEDSQVLLGIHVIRNLNPWINIVAKINNHEHVKIAESAGADQVVSPSSIGGRLLSMVAEEPSAVEWIMKAMTSREGIQLIEYDVVPESSFVNRTVREARKELGDRAKIIGVDTATGLEKIPGDDLKIEVGNKLIMLIDENKLRL
ncbi:NAD-binding protein [Candidatus Woesearchaeota archaeon]|nr:NAD-binding protein [Candidatus Woesearchaeota archaeon]